MQDKHNNPSDRNIQGGCEPCDIRQSGCDNASTASIETSRSAKPKKPAGRSKVFWALASVVLAALTIWAVVSQSRHFTAEGFFIYLKNASPLWLACATLCMLCFILSEAFAIISLLKYFGCRSSLRGGYIYSTADIFFSAITPSATGGQPASAFFMMRDGISGTVTTISLILNLALYAMSILIIGIIGAAVSPHLFFRLGVLPKVLIIFGIIAQIFLTVMFLMLLRHGAIIRRVGSALIKLLSRLHRHRAHPRIALYAPHSGGIR